MTDSKQQMRALTQHLRDAGVQIMGPDGSLNEEALRDCLNEFEVHSTSPCGSVHVFLSGAGQLIDVVIQDDALARIKAPRMGELLATTINTARGLVQSSLALAVQSQGR